jgi:N-acetylglucosaminyldiphosphoundecaprenol N-acetyl-beta-D-mannosaminyltransferase
MAPLDKASMTEANQLAPRTEYLGVEFDIMREDAVLAWLGERSDTSTFAYVVTPNVDHLMRLQREGNDLHRAYVNAALCVCDSRLLAMLARVSGIYLPTVTGSDLVSRLFARLLNSGDRVSLVGGDADTIRALRQLYPNIEFIQHQPPMHLRSNVKARAAAVLAVRDVKARFILLAVGSPQQEMLAQEMLLSGGLSGTALCIGAGVDFITGRQSRAPKFLQTIGLEWAWRLASEPRRLWRRYLIDNIGIFPTAWTWHRRRNIEKNL